MRVALLFTDIEGSTRLLESVGDAYPIALKMHHEIIRRRTRDRGGTEFLDAGDGFCLAFPSVEDAAQAALGMQEDLAAAKWPEKTGPLRVRMAIHDGEADFREGQYRGAAVHLTARLLSAAHGGQILASRAARSGGGDPRWTWRRLGTFRLRPLSEPEEIFQLDETKAFPPLNAEHARRHNVPLPSDAFVGRSGQLAELDRLLHPGSPGNWLVTLTGSGGIGKTRLAIEAGLRLLDAYDHGVIFVPLADISDAGLVYGEILKALGLSSVPTGNPLQHISRCLGGAPTLLILDNLEQLRADTALILTELRKALPRTRFLVTARARAGLSSERELPVGALPVPEANTAERLRENECVRLFVERAQQARGFFSLAPENAQAVADICRLLDGLPLAVELAAARLQVLTAPELLETLRTEFSSFGSETIPGVSATLHAAFEWSRSLLPADIAGLLASLSVFRGGGTAAAIAEVHETTPTLALAYLHYLLTCSLVRAADRGGTMRFEMLEPIRQMAQASGGERVERAVERHSEHFRKLAWKVASLAHTAQEIDLPREIEPEVGNILAAIDRAATAQQRLVSAVNFHHFAISHPSGRSLRVLLHERAGDGPVKPPTQAHAWHAAGLLDLQAGMLDEAEAALQQAARLYGDLGAENEKTSAHFNLAIVAARRGDHRGAYAMYSRILEVFRNLPDRRAYILVHMGNQANELGWFTAARGHLDEAAALCEQVGDLGLLADARSTLGETFLRQGNLADASSLVREALALKTRLGHTNAHPLLVSLAEIACRQGKPEDAAFFCSAAGTVIASHGIECSPDLAARLLAAEQASRAPLSREEWTHWTEKGARSSADDWIAGTFSPTAAANQPTHAQ